MKKLLNSLHHPHQRSCDGRSLTDSSFEQICAYMPALEPTTANKISDPVIHHIIYHISFKAINLEMMKVHVVLCVFVLFILTA